MIKDIELWASGTGRTAQVRSQGLRECSGIVGCWLILKTNKRRAEIFSAYFEKCHSESLCLLNQTEHFNKHSSLYYKHIIL